ncbi:Leukotriene A-4 hydrolase [Tetrabaena socialis]|uniref:Leukotriene A-4 hydrolase n=1 Tax=Tetrabaena socialis TaxID=47790 RepID=A0A2J8AC38_9CHLO|nr:Leukotriene A-4 hydrolase [Tetrabaena socialis]|eukprot:PNH10076.1 Leukotriene A-4 hydrolase [Tetrabaena socialis]
MLLGRLPAQALASSRASLRRALLPLATTTTASPASASLPPAAAPGPASRATRTRLHAVAATPTPASASPAAPPPYRPLYGTPASMAVSAKDHSSLANFDQVRVTHSDFELDVDLASKVIEGYVTVCEAIAGEYVWGRYDLLLLPPSFPYGGMENPCLTFVTPTLLAGDRSLTNVVAHEIAHSWTGNLVTNASWEHFWLNEGAAGQGAGWRGLVAVVVVVVVVVVGRRITFMGRLWLRAEGTSEGKDNARHDA